MKKILLLFLIILFTSGCNSNIISERKDEEGFVIGTSNKVDNSKMQVKVIIDKINMRLNAGVDEEKIGVVEKDSVFDVIDYEVGDRFIWFKIETDNHLKGYIASDLEDAYVEVNQTIDYVAPTVSIKKDTVSAKTRKDVEKTIKNNVTYSDDKDPNPTLEYTINYNNEYSSFYYPVEVTVTDESKNSKNIYFKIKITDEKQMVDGKWLTYKQIVNLQKKAKKLCKNYSMNEWNDAIGCEKYSNNTQIMIANNGVTRIGFQTPYIYCNYKLKDLSVDYCEDKNGNIVEHSLISQKQKDLETTWLKKFKNYLKDVKKTTGYDLINLYW